MPERDPAERTRELEKLVGTMVATKYHVTRLIGRGGMGAVYEAENVAIGKKVALKLVDRELAQDETIAGRFAREARAASSIESEHIVQVFDAGSDGGRPYIVMELLRGEDLGTRLRREDRVPMDDALHIVAQSLRGLARAHGAGIVHRDLKPDNLFLSAKGEGASVVKIVDFGISKIARAQSGTAPLVLTHKGLVMGTPLYMSPEQAQAFSDVDGRADLYSLGAILFECLAGRPPHTGNGFEQVLIAICMTDAPDVRAIAPSVPDDVAEFVARALKRDRRERFASAAQMLDALHAIAPIEKTRVPLEAADVEALGAIASSSLGARASEPSSKPVSNGARRSSQPGQPGPATGVTWANPSDVPSEPAELPPSRVVLPLTALIATLTGVAVTMWIVAAMHGDRGANNGTAKEVAPIASTAASSAPSGPSPSAKGNAVGAVALPKVEPIANGNAGADRASEAASPVALQPASTLQPASSDTRAASKPVRRSPPAIKGAAPKATAAPDTARKIGAAASSDLDLQRDLP